MKIDDIYRDMNILNGSTETIQRRRSEAQEEPSTGREEESAQGTSVRISSASLEFGKVAEMMDRESPERVARVEDIQRRVAEGTYQVDPVRVAEKIIAEGLAD